MIVEVTEQDCSNVKLALFSLSKSEKVNEEGMKTLLILSDKFTFIKEINNEDENKN